MMWYLSLHTRRPIVSDFEIPASYKMYFIVFFVLFDHIQNEHILSSRLLYLFCTQTIHNNYLLTKYNHAWPCLYSLLDSLWCVFVFLHSEGQNPLNRNLHVLVFLFVC